MACSPTGGPKAETSEDEDKPGLHTAGSSPCSCQPGKAFPSPHDVPKELLPSHYFASRLIGVSVNPAELNEDEPALPLLRTFWVSASQASASRKTEGLEHENLFFVDKGS